MIIVEFNGGLGNQMFQYALYLQLKECGRSVKIDKSSRYGTGASRPFCLEVFDIEKDYAVQEELSQYKDEKTGYVNQVRRKIFGKKETIFREVDEKYLGEVLEQKEGIITGFWQSEEYFKGVKEQVRMLYNKERVLDPANREILRRIKFSNSISMHIRRGDYTWSDVSAIFGGICTADYYKKAMSYFRSEYTDSKFYIFTNDPEWARQNYTEEDCCIVDSNHEEQGYLDLYLMSFCKHHIIANSSFSWWGAWLGRNKEKQVIAPQRWTNSKEDNRIFCEGWIRI